MSKHPKLTSKDNVPPAVKELCEKVHAVSEGLPALIFVPNADHSRLYPVAVVQDNATDTASQINGYLMGNKLAPPPNALREKHDLIMEAIHAAADYLPTIVFLQENNQLHPVNLVSEVVAEHLKPCYHALQSAQKTAIGTQPIEVGKISEPATT